MNLQEGIYAAVENTEAMASLPLPSGLEKRIREWLNGSNETEIVTYASDNFGTSVIVTKKDDGLDNIVYNLYRFFTISKQWEVSQDVSNANSDEMMHYLLNDVDLD